jgi:malate dehydrogenase (oxaloacetate-decarboxylating)(NADP+)
MKPLFQIAKKAPAERKRIVYAEGEEERVLRAVQVIVDEKLASPILVGRPHILEQRIEKFGLRLKAGVDFEVINPEFDPRYRDFWQTYHKMTCRKGITEQYAKLEMRRRHTLIGSMMIHKGDADGMICGTFGTTGLHLNYINQVLGKREGVNVYAAMNALVLPDRQLVLVDTHVNENPTAEQIAEITILAAEEMRRFGLQPKAALLSHSNFGSSNSESAQKMRAALAIIQRDAPDLEVDGEMHGDTALDTAYRKKMMPGSALSGDANLLVMPNIDAANISYNLLKTTAGNNIAIGPILLGCAKPVHILTPSATVRRIVNMTALCVVDAVAQR